MHHQYGINPLVTIDPKLARTLLRPARRTIALLSLIVFFVFAPEYLSLILSA